MKGSLLRSRRRTTTSWTVVVVTMMVVVVVVLASNVASGQEKQHEESCPGIVVDGTAYITDKKELHSLTMADKNCQFSNFKFNGQIYNPSVKIQAEYWCSSARSAGNYDCEGYLLNKEYVFWNDPTQSFVPDPPPCKVVVTTTATVAGTPAKTCAEIQDTGLCDSSSFRCRAGEYVCNPVSSQEDWCLGRLTPPTTQPLQTCPRKVAFCEDLKSLVPDMKCDCTIKGGTHYTCYDDYRECKGFFQTDFKCPPPETERVYQVQEYCGNNYKLLTAQHYQCYQDDGKVVCDANFQVSTKVAGYRPLDFNQAVENYHEKGEEGGEVQEYERPVYRPMDDDFVAATTSTTRSSRSSDNNNTWVWFGRLFFVGATFVLVVKVRQWTTNDRETIVPRASTTTMMVSSYGVEGLGQPPKPTGEEASAQCLELQGLTQAASGPVEEI